MAIGLTIVLIVLIVCGSVLFGIYMYLCSENEFGMFERPKYEERIKRLEKILETEEKE